MGTSSRTTGRILEVAKGNLGRVASRGLGREGVENSGGIELHEERAGAVNEIDIGAKEVGVLRVWEEGRITH